MILYHGSNMIVDKIDLEKSKPNKDFGKGFYLSEEETQAMEMANFKSTLLGGEATITKFEFDITVMQNTDLRIKIFKEYSTEWADFVFAAVYWFCIRKDRAGDADRDADRSGTWDLTYACDPDLLHG